MDVLEFFQITAAVITGNAMFLVAAYGVWRATKIERKYGVKNGGDHLPFWLLCASAAPGLLVGFIALTLT